jgi:hypothetical protein
LRQGENPVAFPVAVGSRKTAAKAAPKPRSAEPDVDPDLAAVNAAWPTLPEAIRAGILAMVRAAV